MNPIRWYCDQCDFPYTTQKSVLILNDLSANAPPNKCEKCGEETEYPYIHYEPCPKCEQMTLLVNKDGANCANCDYKSGYEHTRTLANHPTMGAVWVNEIGEVIDYAKLLITRRSESQTQEPTP